MSAVLLGLWIPVFSQAPAPGNSGTISATAPDSVRAAVDASENESAGTSAQNPDTTGLSALLLPSSPVPAKDSLAIGSPVLPTFHPKTWKQSTFDVYEIPNRKLTEEIWRHARVAGEPDEDTYQILLFKDSVQHGYLLRGGTQVAKLPDSTMPLVRQKIRSGALSHGGGAGLWRNFWNPDDPLEPFLWKTGLEANVQHAITVVPSSSPLFEQHFGMTFTQRPLRWIVLEAGGHASRYAGGMRRYLENPSSDDPVPDWKFWGAPSPWWHVAAGIAGIKWETSLSNRLFPAYYWLDPYGGEGAYKAGLSAAGLPVPLKNADSGVEYRDGSLMREWREDGNPYPTRRNLAHSLHVKAGNIRYMAHFDPDMYRSVIHVAMFDEVPAPFGQWGFGFVTANGSAHTLLRLDLAARAVLGPLAPGNSLRLLFLRLDIAYRDVQTFHVGASTGFKLDGRAFRPGDKQ